MYTVEFWHPRKSVVVKRQHPLMPGYLLVNTPTLPASATRHWCQFLGAGGSPLAVRDADDIILRSQRGDYDVHRDDEFIPDGTRVLVFVLGLVGRVVRRVRRQYEVLLDAGRRVSVGQSGLAIV
jgi:hypothetical protein